MCLVYSHVMYLHLKFDDNDNNNVENCSGSTFLQLNAIPQNGFIYCLLWCSRMNALHSSFNDRYKFNHNSILYRVFPIEG